MKDYSTNRSEPVTLTRPDPLNRKSTLTRSTTETDITITLILDGTGKASIDTGIGFLDHLLSAFARHGRLDLSLKCTGDLHIDDHHTAEDCGLMIGRAIGAALDDGRGICRFASAYAPLDEALARSVVDISGRSFADVNLGLTRERIGDLSCENMGHILESLAVAARITLHVDVLKGKNDHHRVEAAYKSFGLAFRKAVAASGFDDVPSTKEALDLPGSDAGDDIT